MNRDHAGPATYAGQAVGRVQYSRGLLVYISRQRRHGAL